jgi:hypothetical protein
LSRFEEAQIYRLFSTFSLPFHSILNAVRLHTLILQKGLAKQAKSQVGDMAVNTLRESAVLPLKPYNNVNVLQNYAISMMQ